MSQNKLIIILAVLAIGFAGCSKAPDEGSRPPQPAADSPVEPVADDPNIDVWLESMEVGSRELYSARDAVVASLHLDDGETVADIGAGTGLYTLLFSETVGASGRVYAEDIEPLFLDLINRRTEDAGLDNVTAVLGREDDVTLPQDAMDVIFIADTYHYFTDRQAVMESVYRALKPGGSLVIVDYDLKPGETRPPDKAHVRFGKAGVISEVEFIGFKFVEDVAVEGLSENYFIRFVKPSE